MQTNHINFVGTHPFVFGNEKSSWLFSLFRRAF